MRTALCSLHLARSFYCLVATQSPPYFGVPPVQVLVPDILLGGDPVAVPVKVQVPMGKFEGIVIVNVTLLPLMPPFCHAAVRLVLAEGVQTTLPLSFTLPVNVEPLCEMV